MTKLKRSAGDRAVDWILCAQEVVSEARKVITTPHGNPKVGHEELARAIQRLASIEEE